jgi:tetratricopeptide (TPR) repeat protein
MRIAQSKPDVSRGRAVAPLTVLRLAALASCASMLPRDAAPEAPDSAAAGRVDVALRFERAQALYSEYRLTEAHDAYQKLLDGPGRFTALHRLSRVESTLGEDASGQARRRWMAAAVEHARAAVKAEPDSGSGHLELAVALGRQALTEGPKTRLSLAREIKAEVDRALELDPTLDGAYHVRGVWNRRLSSLNLMELLAARTVLGGVPSGASMEQAVRDLERAVELAPGVLNHRLELGRTYARVDRWDDARRELQAAIDLPETGHPRDAARRQDAFSLLESLRKSGH